MHVYCPWRHVAIDFYVSFVIELVFSKCLQVPVPALKEQIASVTGVLSEQQRLICRGKVLKDDQLLSAYRILGLLMLIWVVEFWSFRMLAAKAGGWGVAVDPDITYALK